MVFQAGLERGVRRAQWDRPLLAEVIQTVLVERILLVQFVKAVEQKMA
jgi:hypothetical protein